MSSTDSIKMPQRIIILRAVIMALVTSSFMSFSLVSINVYLQCVGSIECFQKNFFTIWPRSFAVAFTLAIPIVLFVAPVVMGVSGRRTIPNRSQEKITDSLKERRDSENNL
jgi:hypothetical protein